MSHAYLNGIDVSQYNGTPSTTGLSFAFARSTYATRTDPKYAIHVATFRRAEMVVGAYHFGVGFVTPAAQVQAFLAVAATADLFVLDLERDETKTMTQAQAKEFIRLVQATGRKCGLYHSRSGFPSLGQDYNWVAQWGEEPPSGIKWSFWQWQGEPLDRNHFVGTKAELLALAGRTPDTNDGVRVVTVTLRRWPEPRRFKAKVAKLRRFTATEELAPIPGFYEAWAAGTAEIRGNEGAPHGVGFLELSSGGSAGKYVLASEVTLA